MLLMMLYDRMQRRHPIRRVYPLFWRWVTPKMTRVSSNSKPFDAQGIQRIREIALTGDHMASFGADLDDAARFPLVAVPLMPMKESAHITGISVGKENYATSVPVLNFGALGFGPVSAAAIKAVGLAAKQVDCLANTGEDGLTGLHLASEAGLVWQIGTGYWGCREKDGTFSRMSFSATVSRSEIRLIELKLSQGAKPGHGGFLPAEKNTPYVASILGVVPHTDIRSPSYHSAFQSLPDMLRFICELRDISGKPVGVKLTLGSASSIASLASAIADCGGPDFITVDGGDGGTGAASLPVQNHTGLTIWDAIPALDRALDANGSRPGIAILGSGGIKDGYDLFRLLCLGADGGFFTRAPMVAIGCVQARKCHTGSCPSGLATNAPWRRTAIHPETQGAQLARYYRAVIEECEALMNASGCVDQRQLDGRFLIKRV